jgi:hypothetical protein
LAAHPPSINAAMLVDKAGGVDWYFNDLLGEIHDTN